MCTIYFVFSFVKHTLFILWSFLLYCTSTIFALLFFFHFPSLIKLIDIIRCQQLEYLFVCYVRSWDNCNFVKMKRVLVKKKKKDMVNEHPLSVLPQAVQSVNMSHDLAHAQMDIKFRSLVCVGLKWVCLIRIKTLHVIYFQKILATLRLSKRFRVFTGLVQVYTSWLDHCISVHVNSKVGISHLTWFWSDWRNLHM